jgi:hypothetical protein
VLGREVALGVQAPQRVGQRLRGGVLGALGARRRLRLACQLELAKDQGLLGKGARQNRGLLASPAIAPGCQATTSCCRDKPAALKNASQSMPGARALKSARVQRWSALRSLVDCASSA